MTSCHRVPVRGGIAFALAMFAAEYPCQGHGQAPEIETPVEAPTAAPPPVPQVQELPPLQLAPPPPALVPSPPPTAPPPAPLAQPALPPAPEAPPTEGVRLDY